MALRATAVYTAVTDANGDYILSGLPAGTYTLIPTQSGSTFSPATRIVSIPPSRNDQDFTSEPNNLHTVTMDKVYTADYWGNSQSTFRPGQAICLALVATNHGESTIDVTYTWDVYDPGGMRNDHISRDDWSVSMPPGEQEWWLFRGIQSTGLLGTYTYTASVSYTSETSAGSTTFDIQGYYIDINLLEALTCKDVDEGIDEGRPVNETDTFTTNDERVYAWTFWEGASGPHTIRWEWYRPDGTLHFDFSEDFDYSSSIVYEYSWLSIDYMTDYLGQWHVDFYMDGAHEGTLYFTLAAGAQLQSNDEIPLSTPSVAGIGGSWSSISRPVFNPIKAGGEDGLLP